MGFKIITWNINGLRSLGGAKEWEALFKELNCDILCFQETKISSKFALEQVFRIHLFLSPFKGHSISKWIALVNDFTSYFTFPKGDLLNSSYSGVATYCRESIQSRPVDCNIDLHCRDNQEVFKQFYLDDDEEEDCFVKLWNQEYFKVKKRRKQLCATWKQVDSEGRCVVTKHAFKMIDEQEQVQEQKFLYVFNVYCPRNDQTREEREEYQLRFYYLLEKRVWQILNESPNNHVMVAGDFNTCPLAIDVYDEKEFGYKYSNGQKWMIKLLSKQNEGRQLIDTYRHFHPNATNQFTCWNTQLGARATNYGSRIDFIIVDNGLLSLLQDCSIMSDRLGSDHCPVLLEFKDSVIRFNHDEVQSSSHFSKNCTQSWKEFSSQSSIKRFFVQNPDRPNSSESQSNQKKEKRVKVEQKSVLSYFSLYKTTTTKKAPSKVEVVSNDCPEESCEPDRPASPSSPTQVERQQSQKNQWKQLFYTTPTVPLCSGHNLPCVRRQVRKPGDNLGRTFYSCPKPSAIGPSDHPGTRCNFFKWVPDPPK